MVPISIYGTLDFLSLIEKYRVQKRYQKIMALNTSAPNSDYVMVNDPTPFSNLGHVDHVCIDKTGTITKPSFILSKVYANGKVYQFNDDTLKNLITEYNDKLKTSLTKYSPQPFFQTQSLKSNTYEDPNSMSEQQIDERLNKNFAETRDFGDFSEKNKLMNNIPLINNINALTSPKNTFETNKGEASPMISKTKMTDFDLRASYISPLPQDKMTGKKSSI